MEKKATLKLKTRLGLRHVTESYPEEANFDRATTKSMYPPWRVTRLVFDKVPLEKKKEEYMDEELRRMTEEKIEGLVGRDSDVHGRIDKRKAGERRRRIVCAETGRCVGENGLGSGQVLFFVRGGVCGFPTSARMGRGEPRDVRRNLH